MRASRILVLLAFFVTFPFVASAQSATLPVGYKDPGVAAVFGLIIPGAGQFYSERPVKGALVLAGYAGSVIAGLTVYQRSLDDCTTTPPPNPVFSCNVKYGALWAGGLGAAVFWLGGAISAVGDAHRHNESLVRSTSLRPLIDYRGDAMRVGVRASFR